MAISKEELKSAILDYLEKNRRMTLATSENNIPWAATVMFAYDHDTNLYFISNPQTRKAQHLMNNPRVSVAINHYVNKAGSTMGIQLEGRAEMLDKLKNKKELDLYRARHEWADDYLHDHDLYKIVPSKIYYLDDEKFGPQGREELEL
ncbi:MAG: hypothetical protein A3F35_00425 [Candidatus Woykebacteria bacterium RIFCSPHIGHO2_12_FULL_45_10]|uniref:Pyridoxamine 5'-phosphate oxidase N-terminal domain-containing protein n=1 Tax=Candidatus Woykebacteria bacterium RIFCSPHIGHO2_12_FULL_45_10 TaxID=1802603 RepID=A0A1G1WRD1_9BACT|nr:MAG: hypothetical protein A3F35_00425 [Candidatus Woykebacteria bacterium RIFCSPHIGHO2_12_FULL_45_10]